MPNQSGMRLIILFTGLLYSSIAAAQQVKENTSYTATTAFTIAEKDLIPECITYDTKSKLFFVGSIYKRKIISISNAGEITDFIHSGSDGLRAILGIRADETRRWLWVLASNTPFIPTDAITTDTSYTTAVFKYDIDSRRLLKKYALNDSLVFFNDLAINDAGDVFITDTYSCSIYTIPSANDALELFLPKKSLNEPNGIAVWKNNLFIAGADGVWLVNPAKKQLQLISAKPYSVIGGIDGLYFKDGSLIGIQNGRPVKRILKMNLNEDFNAVRSIDILYTANLSYSDYSPTTGTIVNNRFYFINNAQVRSFDEKGKIFSLDRLRPVTIKKINL